MNSSRILYMIVFAAFFCLAFYGLQSLDFSRAARKNSGSRPIVLLFLCSLGLAWLSTQAVFSLMYGTCF